MADAVDVTARDLLVASDLAGPHPLGQRSEAGPLRRAYFDLNTCRSGATGLTGAIFILAHPLPLVSARRVAGARKGDGKEILSAGRLLSAQNANARGKSLCSDFLEKT